MSNITTGSDGDIPLGTIYTSSGQIDNTELRRFNVVFDASEGYTKSDDKIYIGGVGLTVYRKNNHNVFAVIIDNTFSASVQEHVISGIPLQLAQKGNQYTLLINNTNRDTIVATDYDYFVFNGIPLSANSNDDIIMIEVSGTIDEEKELFWGGLPIITRRIGNDWYLVVSN